MKDIRIDLARLLGFRLAAAADSAKTGAKVGGKVPPPETPLPTGWSDI